MSGAIVVRGACRSYDVLPCPFCGSDKLGLIVPTSYRWRARRVNRSGWVLCHGCMANGPLSCDEALCVEWWNRRATP